MSERPTPEDLSLDLGSCLHSADQYTTRADDAGRLAFQLKSVVRRALHAEARVARLEQALRGLLEGVGDCGYDCRQGDVMRAVAAARAALEE